MKKSDITYHGLGIGGYRMVPAVNVKIYARIDFRTLCAKVSADHDGIANPEFTEDWIKANLGDEGGHEWWNEALSDAWDQLQEDVNAEGVFGRDVKVYSEGRSSGWAYIDGITREDVEGWNAIKLAQWARFAKFARQTADDVPYQYLSLIYLNVFEPWKVKRDNAADLNQRMSGV